MRKLGTVIAIAISLSVSLGAAQSVSAATVEIGPNGVHVRDHHRDHYRERRHYRDRYHRRHARDCYTKKEVIYRHHRKVVKETRICR